MVISQDIEGHFAGLLKYAFLLEDAERVNQVLCQSKWNDFRHFQLRSFFKNTVEVHMGDLSRVLVDEDVITVAVTQSDHVTYHAPDCARLREIQAGLIPQVRRWEVLREPIGKYRLGCLLDILPDLRVGFAFVLLLSHLLDLTHVAFD